MIDCLSNQAWLNPQIDCLLFLQNIRINQPEIIDKFFLSITIFGEFWLPTLICAITYWCVDFRAGVYLFSMESFNIFLAHFFKMMACVYRPWILDEKIHPSALAIPYAKGYSFPSGHSAMSSSILGGLAFLSRKKTVLCCFLILLVLMIGFSRLWLGVHTPQDVVCGLAIGLCLIFAVNKLVNWAEQDSKRYLYLLGITDVLVILALIYIFFFNTYRVDYVCGQILVDSMRQKYTTITAYGYGLGAINGCFLCRRFFPFNPKEVSIKRRILRGIIGAIILILLIKCILEYVFMNVVDMKIALSLPFIVGMFITLIYPIIYTKFKRLSL